MISRKPSSLDYNEDLALPMPKPRHMRAEPSDVPPWSEEESNKSNLLKKRCVTDPIIPVPASLSQSFNDGKKKSRLEAIRSKLSFKDLRKESAKDETHSQVSTQSMDDPKTRVRWGMTGGGITSFSPSTHSLKPKPKSMEECKSAASTSSTTSTGSQVSLSSTRIPLPPSGTFSNIQGTMATPKSLSSRQISMFEAPVPMPTRSPSLKDNHDKTSRRDGPVPIRDFQPDIIVTRPSLETSQKKQQVGQDSTPNLAPPKYPLTRDSPPNIGDLCEGDGKVKYLPKDWLEGSGSPAPRVKTQPVTPSAYGEDEAETFGSPFPGYMPSFKERLQQANISPSISPSQPVSPGMRAYVSATQIDDIVNMVRSIQKQADSGISCISKKLEDLSSWIGDQLKNQIEGISDLGRTNSDLFAKQCQLSREMMKFQLDIRLDIGVMEKRLSDLESGLLDRLESEVRALARSQEELNHRTEALIAKYSSDDNQSFIELQRQKNAEIESEIAHMKAQQTPLAAIAPFHSHPLHHIRPRPSDSSIGSTEPLIRQAALLPPLPQSPQMALVPLPPTRAQIVPENKPAPVFPRSVSLSKKGFLKGIKDMASTSPESKEKTLEKAKSTEDPKKWNVFGFRRRRDQGETPSSKNSSKFPWSSPHRGKDVPTIGGLSNSRSSSPPLPPILRNISSPINFRANDESNVHPAFRGALREGTPFEDGPTMSVATSTQPSGPTQLQSRNDNMSTEHARAISNDKREVPVEASLTASFHTDIQGSSSIQSSQEDTQKMQLASQSDLNSQEWDRISLHEPNSPN